jgi:hypothetical protein
LRQARTSISGCPLRTYALSQQPVDLGQNACEVDLVVAGLTGSLEVGALPVSLFGSKLSSDFPLLFYFISFRSTATPAGLFASIFESWRSTSPEVRRLRFTTLPSESTRNMLGKRMIP